MTNAEPCTYTQNPPFSMILLAIGKGEAGIPGCQDVSLALNKVSILIPFQSKALTNTMPNNFAKSSLTWDFFPPSKSVQNDVKGRKIIVIVASYVISVTAKFKETDG